MSRDPLGRTNRVRYTRSKDDKLNGLPAVTDLSETIDDRISALLVAGANVTLTYDDVANSLTIAASGGAPGSLTDGDKGDITVSASGATWTVDAGAITLAKMADMATSSLIYRKTAGTGVPEVQTLATLKTDLGLTGTNSGDQTTIVGITGTKAQFDTAVTDGNFLYVGDVTSNATHTGEVTGSTALTVDKTAITGKTLVTAAVGDQVLVADASDSDNLKRVTVQTIVDLASGGATDLTYTAATRVLASSTGTDATLPLVTSGDAGLAPASGGGTSNFLRADATWATPAFNYIGPTPMIPAAGEFIGNANSGLALSTAAQVANRTVIAPFVPSKAVTIDQLGCSISTFTAATNVKCIIYDADSNGRPSTVLRETANIDSGSNGTKFASITSLTFTAGKIYWVGIRSSGTPTIRSLGAGAMPAVTWTSAATPLSENTLILTETFANAAATWSYASSQHSNIQAPLILMRVA